MDRYKINILKLIAFIYANTSQLEGIIKGKISFTIETKKDKRPRNKQDLHKENSKMLLRD